MTAKEYLERPEKLRREIRRKRVQVQTLRRMAARFGTELSDIRVQTTPDPSRMQSFLADAADGEREIARLEEKLPEVICDCARLIARLPSEEMARILERRYLDRRTWEEICEEADFCRTAVFMLHKKALDILSPAPEAEE